MFLNLKIFLLFYISPLYLFGYRVLYYLFNYHHRYYNLWIICWVFCHLSRNARALEHLHENKANKVMHFATILNHTWHYHYCFVRSIFKYTYTEYMWTNAFHSCPGSFSFCMENIFIYFNVILWLINCICLHLLEILFCFIFEEYFCWVQNFRLAVRFFSSVWKMLIHALSPASGCQ